MSDRYSSRRGRSSRPYHGRDEPPPKTPQSEGRPSDSRRGGGPPRRNSDRGSGSRAPGGTPPGGSSGRSLADILSNPAPTAFFRGDAGINDRPLQFNASKNNPQSDSGPSPTSGNKGPSSRDQMFPSRPNMNDPMFSGQQNMGGAMFLGSAGMDMQQQQMGHGGTMGQMSDTGNQWNSGPMGQMGNNSGSMGQMAGGGGNQWSGGDMSQMGNSGAMGQMDNSMGQMGANGGMMGQQGYNVGLQESFWGKGYMVYPGDPNMFVPMPGERPVGCKTVVFRDVPFNLTEEMVREICDKVTGSVESCERARGPFCRVRFKDQGAVDKIFSVHGMQVCINNDKSPPYCGRLLVDYVRNNDDLRDYEQEQRRIARELRHQQAKAEEEAAVVQFSSPFIEQITERIKEDTVAGGSINVLVTWLERGHCTKKTSNTFYRLIQLTNSHVKRLQVEKAQVELVLEQAKQKYQTSKGSIVMQLTLIEQVFTSATKKRVWDHFTKAQRKMLDQWSASVKAFRATIGENEGQPEEAGEADMDIDSEEEEERRYQARKARKKTPVETPTITEVIDLSEDEQTDQEMDNANPQIEMSNQQMALASQPMPTDSAGWAAQAAGWATLQTGKPPEKSVLGKGARASPPKMDSPRIDAPLPLETLSTLEPPPPPPPPPEEPEMAPPIKKVKTKEEGGEAGTLDGTEVSDQSKVIEELQRENEELKAKLEKKEEPTLREKETQIKALQLAFVNMQQQLREAKAKLKVEEERRSRETAAAGGTETPSDTSAEIVREMTDGALMSFISIFLHAHPFGASIDYLYSYLHRLQPGVTQSDIERVLQRYPNCYTEELSGVGASIERRWKFIAFENALEANS